MSIWNKLDILKASEEAFIAHKKEGKIYVADFTDDQKKYTGKYISAVFDDDEEPYDVKLKISPRVEVRISYRVDEDKIRGVQISKWKSGKIEKINLSTLSFEGILGLLQIFLTMDLKSIANGSLILDSGIIKDEGELKKHINTLLVDEVGRKIIAEVAQSRGLLEGDVGGLDNKRN